LFWLNDASALVSSQGALIFFCYLANATILLPYLILCGIFRIPVLYISSHILKYMLMKHCFTKSIFAISFFLLFSLKPSNSFSISLVKWTMVGQLGPTATPSTYLPINSGKLVSAVGQTSAAFVSSLGEPTDPIFVCNNWNVGSGNAWFLINFSTTGYSNNTFNFVFGTYPFGPKNFQPQYSTSSSTGPWTNFGSAINFGSSGGSTTNSLTLPSACDNQSNVWVRMVTTTAPTSTGGSFIDEVEVVNSGPLPIELTSFSIQSISKGAQLNWTTGVQESIQNFVIERSFDGSEFTSIGNVDIDLSKKYSFSDESLSQGGKVFYRLKLNYNSLNYKYSTILYINLSKVSTSFSISPNPVDNEEVRISFNNRLHNGSVISVIDISGKTISVREISNEDIHRGYSLMTFKQLAPGHYTLRMQDALLKEPETVSFIKK
jgi:hypothetical protein